MGSPTLPRPGFRVRVLATCHRLVRFGPWLILLGAVLTVSALSVSVVAGAAGALVVGLGVAASLWQPRIRRRTFRPDHPERVTLGEHPRRDPPTRRTR